MFPLADAKTFRGGRVTNHDYYSPNALSRRTLHHGSCLHTDRLHTYRAITACLVLWRAHTAHVSSASNGGSSRLVRPTPPFRTPYILHIWYPVTICIYKYNQFKLGSDYNCSENTPSTAFIAHAGYFLFRKMPFPFPTLSLIRSTRLVKRHPRIIPLLHVLIVYSHYHYYSSYYPQPTK